MNSIPSVILHKPVLIPDITSLEERTTIANDILLDFQGGRVLLSHDSHPASVLLLLNSILEIADEVVVESPSGGRFLTLIHTHDSVIREQDIIVDFAFLDPVIHRDKKDPSPYSLSLPELFPYGDTFSSDDLYSFFTTLSDEVRPAPSATIEGGVPLVPLFFAAHLLLGAVGTLHYTDSSLSEPIQVA